MEVREPDAKYLARPDLKVSELGLLPSDWLVEPLGLHATFRTGPFGSALHQSDYLPGGVPVINPMQIVDGKLHPTHEMAISEVAARKLADFRLNAGDVVIGRRGDMGRCAVVQEHQTGWLCGTGSMIIRSRASADSRYLQRVLSSPPIVAAIASASVGSTMANLNQSTLKKLLFPLPSSRLEQEAIAEVLRDTDALIESLEQLLAKKRQLKQGAMQELLTGKRRLPGFGGAWSLKTFAQLAKIQRGASPRPIESPIWFDDASPIGWVRISDVTSCKRWLRETTQQLSPLGVKNSRPVGRGSLIMSICATVGRPVVTEIDVCIHDGFVVFDELKADRDFLYFFLVSIESQWSRHGQTGSQMNLNTGLINRTEINVPPSREEQVAIATLLSDLDAELEAIEAHLAKARHLKQGMAQALLTGRIRLV